MNRVFLNVYYSILVKILEIKPELFKLTTPLHMFLIHLTFIPVLHIVVFVQRLSPGPNLAPRLASTK